MTSDIQTVAILGASNKGDRYSYKALKLLLKHGHIAIPVHPALKEIDGVEVVASLDQIDRTVDTLSIYVNPTVSANLTDQIIDLNPGRVIFNPGSESSDLAKALDENGISYQEACTLVLLETGQF